MNAPISTPPPPAAPDDSAVGLRFVRSWREVYYLVLVVFVVWVIALTVLPRLFA